MPGRKYNNGDGYRYGFNGKEKSDEVYGEGNVYDYGFRIYNSRIGKFLSVDPLAYSYPYYTPYQFAGNMPIAAIDLDGLEQYVVTYYKDQNGKNSRVEINVVTDNKNNRLNQFIQKTANKQGQTVGDGINIAKGNVLVFEVYNEGTKKEQIKIVDKRNKPESALTAEEDKIFKQNKKPLKETGAEEYMSYPNSKNTKYQSVEFRNSETKAYEAVKLFNQPTAPPIVKKPVPAEEKEKLVYEIYIVTTGKKSEAATKQALEFYKSDPVQNYYFKYLKVDVLILKEIRYLGTSEPTKADPRAGNIVIDTIRTYKIK